MTGARCTWVCICWAAAAMLAMVLRWFICDIAMATDAGGSPMGSRGWGIIIKGRSNPERQKEDKLSSLWGNLTLRQGVSNCEVDPTGGTWIITRWKTGSETKMSPYHLFNFQRKVLADAIVLTLISVKWNWEFFLQIVIGKSCWLWSRRLL